ncbi:copper oxidase [Aeromicrobium sp. PE09-221]|uniref:multicopper oxidase family protein n=1 Tax=Aeromicrobium sp. PE09-221 TaxID=1898043 RepID=UPI000B73EE4C|nr:multicopper oxidase domain-containing protein [Aeromicrobium sp. PE09-221]OUZ12143.1 copper oxidase [Aeromicrobium sp. PE09-221]
MRASMKFLLTVLGTGMIVVTVFTAWLIIAFVRAPLDTVGEVDFDRPLAIPPLAESSVEGGVRTFDLRLQSGTSDLGSEEPTSTWGVNGDLLGPTLRAERGETVAMRVRNDLPEISTLHWHGMHLPAEMDGGPHQVIEPGDLWSPTWTIDQPAATLWYHPHLHGATADHVYRGLAGMFIVDDPVEAELDLPRDYGVDDLPLIVQDKNLDEDGRLDMGESFFGSAGIIGETVFVNGTRGAYADVTTEAVRLRLLNGSNARPFSFTFADGRDFDLIGTDGGLLEAPAAMDALQLSPGERAEIIVRFEPGERIVLRSEPSDTGNTFAGGQDRLDIMEFRAADRLDPSPAVPDQLVEVPRLDPEDASEERSFRLAGSTINGREMDMQRVDEVVEAGAAEIWTVTNDDGGSHNFHVHDVQFQVLDIDGREPPPHLRGWKDTVWLRPSEPVRLIMRFGHHTSTEWPYMFHCHTLRHEDDGMMGQFMVVEPGQSPTGIPHAGEHAHDH